MTENDNRDLLFYTKLAAVPILHDEKIFFMRKLGETGKHINIII